MNIVSKFHNLVPPASILLKLYGLQNYKSILDLGCGGNSVLRVINGPYKLGVDAFQEYLDMSESKNIHNKYLLADINNLDIAELIKDFEAVIVFDVLEHLTNSQANSLIKTLENNPNLKFISFRTTSRFLKQDDLDENEFQRHKTFIPAIQFVKSGYKVYGVDGPIFLNVTGDSPRGKTNLLKSILSLVLRPIYLFFPDKSMNYLAILKR